MQVTIYDIAKMAGVSASTVSRVVNNKSTVNAKTRARILKLLAEHNYVPNESARELVKQSSRLIGVLISDIRTTHHTNGIYFIEKELSANGYTCLIHNTGRDENNWVAYFQSLSQRKIEALILVGSIYQTDLVREAISLYLPSIPVVISNGYMNGENIYGILSDEQGGVTECVSLLAAKGRKHPAFLMNQVTPSNEKKKLGFEEGMARFFPGMPVHTSICGNEIDTIAAETRTLLQRHPEIDSLIYSEDLLAVVGLRTLADLGRRVPEDMMVIGINNSNYAKLSIPTLTSLDNMLYDVSITAARNVLSLLSGQRVSRKMLICTEIVERQSTRRESE